MTNPTNIILLLGLIMILFLFYVLAFRMNWREIWAYLLPPLAKKIPPYITPNQLSIMGFFVLIIAALLLYLAKFNYFFFLWTTVAGWLYAVIDSLDGILARIRDQTSNAGTFLDQTLGQVNELIILFALILGGHIRTELVVITMIGGLFYGFITAQSQALTGSRLPEADRPRWLMLAFILLLMAFFVKFFGLETFSIAGVKIRSLDAFFIIVPIYYLAVALYRTYFFWRELNKLDHEIKRP